MRRGELTDVWVVVAAAGAVLGAWVSRPAPMAVVVLGVVMVLVLRSPLLLVVVVAVAASTLGARAWDGMRPPDAGATDGVATLVTDPVRRSGAVQAVVRLHGRHLDAWARGAQARQLSSRLAGERVHVRGAVEGGRVPPSLELAHVVGRITLQEVRHVDDGNVLHRVANVVRRTLERGARTMSGDERALFTGLVIGDDREQSVEVTDDFRGAGLTHLLAVSGQNVAFVLTVAAPLTRRLGQRWRLVVTLAIIVLFATITRFEPSVLRAAVMAGLACTASTLGRPVGALRTISLAVTGLVLVDPFLARSVGFGLSVGASVGIVLVAEPIARRLVGPDWLRRPLAVVAAAQLGVAPLLLAVFGGLPVATLPANLLAGPVAGFVMTWGATAGLVAGMFPALATLVHVPTTLAVWWVAAVARGATGAALGELDGRGLGLLVVFGAAALLARRRAVAAGCWVAVAVTLVAPAVVVRRPVTGPTDIAGVGTLWRSTNGRAALLVSSAARPGSALRALRGHGVRRIDLMVLEGSGRAGEIERVLASRIALGQVWSGAERRRVGEVVQLGDLAVRVEQVTPLQVSVGTRDPPA
jgi:competence protein ComEC